MVGAVMILPVRFPSIVPRSLLAAVVLALAGCAQQAVVGSGGALAQGAPDAADAPRDLNHPGGARADAEAQLPTQDLTETILYEFLLAEIAGQRGNIGLSAQAYADLARRTRDPRIARRATEIAIYARMINAAIEAAHVWYETDNRSLRPLQTLTGLLVNANRLDEALPLMSKLLAANGSNPADSFMQLNRTLATVSDKKAALNLVQSLVRDYDQLPQAHYAAAQAAENAGEHELALKETRRAQDLRPEWEAAVLFEAQLLQKSANDQAAARLARYLEKYPNSRDVRLNYARTLVAAKRYAEAHGEFQKLLANFPAETEVLFAVGLLSMQLNDYALAETNLRRLLDMDYRDKNNVRLYLGQIAEEQKKFPDALRWYREVERGEQFIAAQVRYAQVLAKEGKLAEARAHLQQVEASSSQQRVQLTLAEAQLLRDANQPKMAFELVQQALDRLPNHPELLYDYAMLAERIDRIDILESSLKKLINLQPDHAHAYNALGYTLADRNERLDEARGLIERALKLSPGDAFIIDSMGWVLYRMGNLKESVNYLRRAFAERPDPEIAAHLGEVLWVIGERGEAEKVWRDAVTKSPQNDTLLKTIKRLNP